MKKILSKYVPEDVAQVFLLRRDDMIARHWVSITRRWYTDDYKCFVTKNYESAVVCLELLEMSDEILGGMYTSVEGMLVTGSEWRPNTKHRSMRNVSSEQAVELVEAAAKQAQICHYPHRKRRSMIDVSSEREDPPQRESCSRAGHSPS